MATRAFSAAAIAVVGIFLATVLASPARADDPVPLPVFPSEATGNPGYVAPPDPTVAPTPHPLKPVQSVSPPSQQQIDDAKKALARLRKQGKAKPTTLAQVAAPRAEEPSSSSLGSRIDAEGWWTIGAGLLVLLVISETTRVSVRRAKHRKQA